MMTMETFRNKGISKRDKILGSQSKRRHLQLVLEELSRTEMDIPQLSYHTSLAIGLVQQNNLMLLPKILEQIKRQKEPLVLEITRNISNQKPRLVQEVSTMQNFNVVQDAVQSTMSSMNIPGVTDETVNDFTTQDPTTVVGDDFAMGKQFEIIFSDSIRQTDVDSDNHIIHSTTESTGTSEQSESGMVNVPNSFPLFQLVHTGEVPEDVQQEIVRLIRQANPQLDLNSITFQFKSPQTVEIIANVNS